MNISIYSITLYSPVENEFSAGTLSRVPLSVVTFILYVVPAVSPVKFTFSDSGNFSSILVSFSNESTALYLSTVVCVGFLQFMDIVFVFVSDSSLRTVGGLGPRNGLKN